MGIDGVSCVEGLTEVQKTKADMRWRRDGFTLIEVVLAVALSALLLTIVYWTYFNIDRSIRAATEGQDALETGRMLTEMIKKDIRGMITDRFSFTAKNQTVDGLSLGQMEFVTTAGFHTERMSLGRIGYELIINDKGDKILVRKESTDVNDPLDSTATVYELSRIVRGFKLEFYNGTDWTQTWDSDVAGSLPKQVRVTVDISDTKGNDKRFAAEESIQSAIQ
jgi:type II secretion system protein J